MKASKTNQAVRFIFFIRERMRKSEIERKGWTERKRGCNKER